MLLLVGLGNPGSKYAANRHNIGFMAVDETVRRHGFPPWRDRFSSAVAEGAIAGARVMAVKPQTWMNLSGDAVGAACRFYKIDPAEVFVVHDELDLKPAKVRVKRGGGSAGHNGLRSLDAAIGADYWRIRIGIGHPGVKELVHPYVLQNFAEDERPWVARVVEAVAEAMPLLVGGEAEAFMTRVALLTNPPPPKPARAATPPG